MTENEFINNYLEDNSLLSLDVSGNICFYLNGEKHIIFFNKNKKLCLNQDIDFIFNEEFSDFIDLDEVKNEIERYINNKFKELMQLDLELMKKSDSFQLYGNYLNYFSNLIDRNIYLEDLSYLIKELSISWRECNERVFYNFITNEIIKDTKNILDCVNHFFCNRYKDRLVSIDLFNRNFSLNYELNNVLFNFLIKKNDEELISYLIKELMSMEVKLLDDSEKILNKKFTDSCIKDYENSIKQLFIDNLIQPILNLNLNNFIEIEYSSHTIIDFKGDSIHLYPHTQYHIEKERNRIYLDKDKIIPIIENPDNVFASKRNYDELIYVKEDYLVVVNNIGEIETAYINNEYEVGKSLVLYRKEGGEYKKEESQEEIKFSTKRGGKSSLNIRSSQNIKDVLYDDIRTPGFNKEDFLKSILNGNSEFHLFIDGKKIKMKDFNFIMSKKK